MKQPQCGGCNHPLSFHPNHDYCCATGCQCDGWVKPQPEVEDEG